MSGTEVGRAADENRPSDRAAPGRAVRLEGSGEAAHRPPDRWVRRQHQTKRIQRSARAEYAGREPLFDLAAIQSARPGGGRMVFESNGKEYLALAPELTSDGGHLNEQGKRVVAEALLAELARIASTPAR